MSDTQRSEPVSDYSAASFTPKNSNGGGGAGGGRETTAATTTTSHQHQHQQQQHHKRGPPSTPLGAKKVLGDTILELREISKSFPIEDATDVVHALRNISLSNDLADQGRGFPSVRQGEFVMIRGPSGGGKTTLLNIVGTIDLPTNGTIRLLGSEISKESDEDFLSTLRLKNIGFVFQTFNLLSTMSALENVELPMTLLGELTEKERKSRAKKLLALVGLRNRVHHLPSELSGGEQQRVTIARALANNPGLLLLDEPTGDLDTATTISVMDLLAQINCMSGVTCIMVTHNPDVECYADRILYVEDGRFCRQVINSRPLPLVRDEYEAYLREVDNIPVMSPGASPALMKRKQPDGNGYTRSSSSSSPVASPDVLPESQTSAAAAAFGGAAAQNYDDDDDGEAAAVVADSTYRTTAGQRNAPRGDTTAATGGTLSAEAERLREQFANPAHKSATAQKNPLSQSPAAKPVLPHKSSATANDGNDTTTTTTTTSRQDSLDPESFFKRPVSVPQQSGRHDGGDEERQKASSLSAKKKKIDLDDDDDYGAAPWQRAVNLHSSSSSSNNRKALSLTTQQQDKDVDVVVDVDSVLPPVNNKSRRVAQQQSGGNNNRNEEDPDQIWDPKHPRVLNDPNNQEEGGRGRNGDATTKKADNFGPSDL